MDAAIDADLYLACGGVGSRYAKVDAGGLAYAVGDAEGSIGFEAHDHAEHEHEDGYEYQAAEEGDENEQPFVVDEGGETDASPAKPEEEVDEVAEREQREDAG